MLKTFWAIMAIWLCGLAWPVFAADTYSLADGTTVSGDILTFNDAGIKFRTGDDKYTDVMPWTQFSQEGLRQLAQNPKIRPLVEPFMELPATAKTGRTDNIAVHDATGLTLPPPQSLLGAMASSSVGFFLLVLVYLANLYAAFEVAICRGRPKPVVMGLSAILPVIGPAIFFLLPTLQVYSAAPAVPGAEGEATAPAAGTPAPAPAAAGQAAASAPPPPAGARNYVGRPAPAATTEIPETPAPQFEDIQVSAMPAIPKESPVSQVFKRGQFTFNRRFFETKFAGFLQPSRSEADKKLDFIIKIPQGEFVVQRISRVGTGDIDFDVVQDGQPKVILVPFGDIQEINIKSKTV